MMNQGDLRAWFENLVKLARKLPHEQMYGRARTLPAAAPSLEWVTEAESALPAVFPEWHPVSQNWSKAWCGLRNEAAHDPGNFKRTKEEVKLMIEGIRQFIARTG
jgi:hypothetical protein